MGELSSSRRKKLPTTSFAIPSERAYPIDTVARARNALARVAQFGNLREIAQVKRAVKKKYPSIKQGD